MVVFAARERKGATQKMSWRLAKMQHTNFGEISTTKQCLRGECHDAG